ncbi:MAG: universal stress protein [Steroidobacteraceae bacterium]
MLVAIRDLDRVPPSQLRKAAAVARAAGAHIELFHVNGEPLIPEGMRRRLRRRGVGMSVAQIIEKSREQLERLGRSQVFAGLKVETHMAHDYPPHEAIVRRVQATRADLVVAATSKHSLAGRLFLLNTDWELIRCCPCPILFVKSRGDYERPKVLAAIDPFHEHAKPASLERLLLGSATQLARLLRGQAHAFHAYLPLVVRMLVPTEEGPVWVPPGAEEANGRQVAGAFNRLARRASIARGRRHLECGDVPSRLSSTVKAVGADIVVMGAVSRSGLKRLFVGSTAERVIDELHCDVLIVKPAGFKAARSQVRPPSISAVMHL